MPAYYNENDRYAAQWLRNLIAEGQIAPGDVDERDIQDVSADDLKPYRQCHFFAGIGGWSVALRLAGWPDERPVWTGSCPCQPFSAAGKGKAGDDERHLWPCWFSLIAERRPAIVFGEQVEASVGWGWLDVVCADLEDAGYACGATVLPACGVGAPHIRSRLWFVADHAIAGWLARRRAGQAGDGRDPARLEPRRLRETDGGSIMGDTADSGRERNGDPPRRRRGGPEDAGVMGDTGTPGLPPRQQPELSGPQQLDQGRAAEQPGRSPWSDLEWLACSDGKARPTQPGLFPLADGLRNRASQLRAYGNAIVPQVAAQFIKATMEAIDGNE